MLARYADPVTRGLRDDIAQDASLHLWEFAGRLQDPRRIGAALRTIVRRRRYQTLRARRRCDWLRYVEFGVDGLAEPCTVTPREPSFTIAGCTVPIAWARSRLHDVLARLPRLDRQLLLGFYEGFCCAELASRYGRTEDCVKTRIHRARRRVRGAFESLVRLAGRDCVPQLEVDE